jgi:hypothetical protein
MLHTGGLVLCVLVAYIQVHSKRGILILSYYTFLNNLTTLVLLLM